MICNFKNLFVPLPVAPAPPVYAECSQTYLKLVQGERKSKLVFDFSEPPPNFGLSKVTQKNEQIVNSVLLIYSLRMRLNPKYTDNLGL